MPRRVRLARRIAALGSAIAIVAAVPVITARPAVAEVGLSVASSTVFRVLPAESVVRVEATYTVTNLTADLSRGGTITRYYYDRLTIPVPRSATALRAVDDDTGSPLAASVRADADLSLATAVDIVFARPLFHGESVRFTVSYRLESGAPRDTTSGVRVNPAYAVFDAWGLGDANAVDVRVEVPADFEVSISGSPYRSRLEGGLRIYEATAIARPEEFFLFITARNDAALASRVVDIGDGNRIDVRYWPGDEVWADFVVAELGNGFIELDELIGIPFPVVELEILQSVDPGLLGYAGWYLPDQDRIEVSEALDAETLLHELSHAWFDPTLFAERWITEGLAQEFASRALAASGGDLTHPTATRSGNRYRVELNHWSSAAAIDDETRGTDAYGYRTSWFVLRQVSDEIGIDRLAEAVRWADADLHAYPGEGPPERVAQPIDDWRRLLDLLEETAGSRRATALFAEYVVSRDQASLLSERTRIRAELGQLRARSDGWALPAVLRTALGDWDFVSARHAIATANHLLDQRDRLRDTVEPLDLEVVPSPEHHYQDASALDVLEALALRLADLQSAADTIAEADRQLAAERSVIERVGLLGTDVSTPFRDARVAFENGDTDLARASADSTITDLRGAAGLGWARIGLTGAGAGLVLLVVGRRRSGGHRRRQPLHRVDGRVGEDVEVRAGVGVAPESDHQVPGVGQDGGADAEVETEGHDRHHLGDPGSAEVQRGRWARQVRGHDVGEGLTPGHPRDEVDGDCREVVAGVEK